jgi:DNA-directed RNA polymerase beta' subunit
MRMDICDLNKFIQVNSLQEVKNPILLEPGNYPTKDGLLSYDIFGLAGSYDRRTVFAYIDLKKHFLHPLMYKLLTSMNRKLIKLIDGSGYFTINNKGELIEDNENGNTGLEWLYNNFEKINFEYTESHKRNSKVTVLNTLKKNEIFCDKWIVIPANHRDVNLSKTKHGKISTDKLNTLYTGLLSLCSSSDDEFDFMGYITESKIQLKLVEIYEYLIQFLEKKDGLFKHDLMGKTVDYCTRSVISAPRVNSNKFSDQLIKFTYTGIPLSHLCNLFYPYFQYEIKNFFEELFSTFVEYDNPLVPNEVITLVNPMSNFTPEKIKNMLNLFIKSPENRLDTLQIDSVITNKKTGKQREAKSDLNIYYNELHRPFLLLDLVYLIADKIVEDKHVYVSRYPIENYQSIYPTRIKIITTYNTTPIEINNRNFPDYPLITMHDLNGENRQFVNFIDTVLPHASYLESLGADFDGDTISLRPIYSQEANEECERIINSLPYIMNASGNNTRIIRNEGVLTLYTLTRNP